MDPWNPDSELRDQGYDPARLLSIGEAARLAGVSDGTIRKRVEAGRLLAETGLRGGRELQVVRMGDLALLYPSVIDASRAGEAATPARTESERNGVGREESEKRHEAEIELASERATRRGLALRIESIEDQWSDLKQQNADLKSRLALVEKERRTTTAALLAAQGRLLQVESGETGRFLDVAPSRPRWKRATPWALGLCVVLIAWIGWALLGETKEIASQLEAEQLSARENRELLGRELAEARGETALVLGALEQQGEVLGSLHEEAESERAKAEELRTAFLRELAASREATHALELSLRDSKDRMEAVAKRAEESNATVAALRLELEGERQRGELEASAALELAAVLGVDPEPDVDREPADDRGEPEVRLADVSEPPPVAPPENGEGPRACSFFAMTNKGEELRDVLGPCLGEWSDELGATLGGHIHRGRAYCEHHHFFGRYLSASVEKALEVADLARREGGLPPLLRLRVVRRAADFLAKSVSGKVGSGLEGATRDEHTVAALAEADVFAIRSWVELATEGGETRRVPFVMKLGIDGGPDGDRLISFEELEDE